MADNNRDTHRYTYYVISDSFNMVFELGQNCDSRKRS